MAITFVVLYRTTSFYRVSPTEDTVAKLLLCLDSHILIFPSAVVPAPFLHLYHDSSSWTTHHGDSWDKPTNVAWANDRYR